jgi:putative membrane-bound dehydrogenase-like protein
MIKNILLSSVLSAVKIKNVKLMKLRLLSSILVVALFSCTKKELDVHSPDAGLSDLKVYQGLDVSLFASEPMLSNPTNMDIDSKGRIWICEGYNYRNQLNPKNPVKKEGDRIMILEDTDGDGKADKSKVFYQGNDVNSALGISVLGNKVIVSCSPNVFVFTDDNGDDVPDKKEILFQGIKGLQHDHAVHAFIFGHDGRLYFNMGNEGEVLLDAKGDTVVDVNGKKVVTNGKPFRDGLALRCDLDGSNVEVLGHNFRNNYELVVDPYGTIWQSDNDDDGNKGVRINYVMEYGNFGFKDEMTGASWGKRRTNIEKEIPHRHWHLNDPGVVPNLLQTGSGSPTGMVLYEGTMLSEIFQGQMIHSEPGHNVVRSYPVENDGAGYQASIVNILEGQTDKWFRPADVTVAPDGSIFIADWYDPGVGGHQVGDLDRGRVYRVSNSKGKYSTTLPNVTNVDGAISALLNPNPATRYLGWTALASFGLEAEGALKRLWTSANPRQRAQALWLLVRLKDKGDGYLQEALVDTDVNIKIAGLRAARMLKEDLLPIAKTLVSDPSLQVRREVAIAIRGNKSAADIWAQLAVQHDGKDRWYLEALGIGAEGNWDLFFAAWQKQAENVWDTPAGRDIVWRSRTKASLPLLAELIKKSSNESDMLRYYRAFDFQNDPSKQKILAQLVGQTEGSKVLFAFKHMDGAKLKMTPSIKASLDKVLDQQKGKVEFVELVSSFKLQNRSNDLLALGLQYPDSVAGKEAIRTLLDWDKIDMLNGALYSKNMAQSQAIIKTLRPAMNLAKTISMMEKFALDSTRDLELRKLAIKNFGGPGQSEDRLLELAKDKKIPSDLHIAAAGVFQSSWRGSVREEAAKYITLASSKESSPLPAISVMASKEGNVGQGAALFNTLCSNCHQVNKQGVNFGPDLSEIGSKLSKEAMYKSILFPDQGVSFGFEGWRLKLKDGSEAFGRIVSETTDKVDVQYLGNTQSVNTSDIVSRMKVESSLMPSNLQSSMSEEDLVSLVEYLMGLKTPAQ